MEEQVKTLNNKFLCLECQNEVEVSKDKKIGDVIECPFCGIEFEIVESTSDGEFVLQLIEEEK